jgi:hypothetical protein
MRGQLLSVAMMIAATGAYALLPVQQHETAGEPAPKAEAGGGENGREGLPTPAPGFTPTEKIEADSAVSFPVDI